MGGPTSVSYTHLDVYKRQLLCCLTYEQEFYEEVTKKMPRVGQQVITPDGEGEVFKLSILEETVFVKMQLEKDETEVRKYLLADIQKKKQEKKPERKPERKREKKSEKKPEKGKKDK